jgi:hypothetical protein
MYFNESEKLRNVSTRLNVSLAKNFLYNTNLTVVKLVALPVLVCIVRNYFPSASFLCTVSLSLSLSLSLYSCCSQLERRSSVKHLVSLQFLLQTDIRALSEIRTHDPSVRAGEGNCCLRPRDHCDRLLLCTV